MTRRARPRWGQCFLVNRGVAQGIVERAELAPGDAVVEIGPGRGALTHLLAERTRRLVLVEVDRALAAALEEQFAGRPDVSVLQADATKVSWSELTSVALAAPSGEGATGVAAPSGAAVTGEAAATVKLVANLPYDVGTAILLDWLEASAADPRLDSAVVMVQAEVAERLAAPPGSKAHGSLGVLAQCTHEIELLMRVGPGSFRPRPRVQSRVVRLARSQAPLFEPAARAGHAAFIHAAFGHRRKQLATALDGLGGRSRDEWREVIQRAGNAPTVRGEALSASELVGLWRSTCDDAPP